MKTHLRIIDLRPKARAQFRVACGCPATNWTRDTTSDLPKVDCRRCRQSAENLIAIGKARMEPVYLMRRNGEREILRHELVILGQNSKLRD